MYATLNSVIFIAKHYLVKRFIPWLPLRPDLLDGLHEHGIWLVFEYSKVSLSQLSVLDHFAGVAHNGKASVIGPAQVRAVDQVIFLVL